MVGALDKFLFRNNIAGSIRSRFTTSIPFRFYQMSDA